MNYSRTALSDAALIQDLEKSFARDRTSTALLLADIAEVDARKLYLPVGYSSMHAYCVDGFGLTRDSAFKRIHAARAAREFPEIFEAVEDGRLNLSKVCLLAPHLTPGTAAELITAVAGKSKFETEAVIAARFPRTEEMPMVETFSVTSGQLAPGQVEAPAFRTSDIDVATEQVDPLASGPARAESRPVLPVPPAPPVPPIPSTPSTPWPSSPPRSKVAPIATERFTLHLTFGKSGYDKLCYAQSLLGHQVPNGDLGAVLERVLDLAIGELEKRKFGATHRPRAVRRFSQNARYIPRHVRRAVWERDGGQCTFVSATGHRCEARTRLEFDHVDPVARGGTATLAGVRLRCRAHNQYAAECAFGAEFMATKREEAKAAREAGRARLSDPGVLREPPSPTNSPPSSS